MLVKQMLEFVVDGEWVCLPSHSLVQASGQRNRLQDGLQHSELVCLCLTCDREQQVSTQESADNTDNDSAFFHTFQMFSTDLRETV